ncbi:MAG TPA: hypothetical protein VIK78_14680 [Ruminiclostridium sp.]
MADEIEQVAANEVDPATSTETTQETTQEVAQPDVSTTKAFSDRLKETNSKAIDAEYSRLFGAEHNIHTKAEYDKAIANQQEAEDNAKFQEDNGFDPNSVKPLFEQWKQNDPDFQELSSIRQQNKITEALTDLNSELKDCGIDLQLKDLSAAEVAKIPNADKVTDLVSKGKTLSEAVFLANKKDFFAKQTATAQQDTIKKIAANGLSSPGSLGGGGDNSEKTVYSMSKADFAKMQNEVLRGERKQL